MKANIPPFHVGQKIVCIDDVFFYHGSRGERTPVKDKVYTVRGVYHSINGFSITLVEIINPPMQYYNIFSECRFLTKRFVSVKEQTAPLLTFENIKETESEEILIMN